MLAFKPALDDFGRHGELRVLFPLWLVFALFTRHLWFTGVVIASASKVRESAVLLADFSWWPLLIEAPALLVVAVVFLRKPETGALPRWLWRRGREILAAVGVAQLAYIAWRWSEVDRASVLWSFVDAGLAAATVLGVVWLYASPYARAVFGDFPAPRQQQDAIPPSPAEPAAAAFRSEGGTAPTGLPLLAQTRAGTPAQSLASERSADDRPLVSRSDESAARLQRIVALFAEKEFEQAERLCRELLDENRNDPDALHLLGVMRHYLGDDNAAVVLIGRAITLVPDFVPYYVNLAAIYRAIGRPEDAARLEERVAVLERSPPQPALS
jgi:hypothetical protein